MRIEYTKFYSRLQLLAFAFTALFIAGFVHGQAVASSAAAQKLDDEVITLSPFVVNSERDVGYTAQNTLAGTRLSTSVKDIGASISIYTKEFLTDIGATNANEFLVYATAMEAAGAQGNYSGATTSINAAQVTGNAVRGEPQNGTRTRGLSAPNFTRGFFGTSIPMDSFNTEAVTVNRGPNAILFGVGSPAGVVNTALIQANLRRNMNKVEFRYGNNDSTRSTFDFNRVLIRDKLAIRLAAVDDDEEYNQRPAFARKRDIYATVTAKPFRSTTLRTSFETGNTIANRPLTVLPFDSASRYWYAAGQPTVDWRPFDDPALNANAATQNTTSFAAQGYFTGLSQIFDQIAVIYSQPNASTPDLAFRTRTNSTTTNALNLVRAKLFHPLVNRDLAADTIGFFSTFNLAELADGAFPGGVKPAGIKYQGFTDFSAFDFANHMLDETSRQGNSFHTFNITLEQLAWKDRLGVELAYNSERYDSYSKNSFMQAANNNNIYIDTNVMLPTGQPNPNVGRPFIVYGQTIWDENLSNREDVRATGFLRYDFNDASPRLGKWLGRHSLTGLYQRSSRETIYTGTRLVSTGEVADAMNSSPIAFARRPAVIVYLGDSVLGGKPLTLQPIRVPQLNAGLTVPTTFFAAPLNSTAQGDFAVAPTTLRLINDGGSASREVIESQAFVLQSYWLSEHLITTLGWRRDEDFLARKSFTYAANNPDKVHYNFDDFDFPSTPPPTVAKEVKTYSAVLRWPQKLMRLPFGIDASVFVNKSENFTPLGGRVDAYGVNRASPVGSTREFGVNLSFLNDRFILRANRYETAVQGQTFSSPSFIAAINNAVLQNTGFWATEQNINPSIDRSADVELMYSVLPSNFRDLYQWKITGTAAAQNLSNSYTLIPGLADTTDFTAKGTEIELTFNPNRQWRILLNVARQETVQSNSIPGAKEIIERLMPVWNKLRNVPRVNYPAGYVAGDPLPPNVQTFGQWLDQFVMVPYATAIATEGSASPEQRKWRANFVANYTFAAASRLKGWNVGTGVRWQDKLGIGYPVSYNPNGSVHIDIQNPYYGPAETNVDAFIGYTRKLFRNSIEWKMQLNVRNVIGSTDPVAVTVQPWGETAITRLAPERRWYITNTFSF